MRKAGFSPGALVVPVLMGGFALVYALANQDVPDSDMRMVTPATIALFALSSFLFIKILWNGPEQREAYTVAAIRRPVALIASTLILLFGSAYDFPIAAAVFLLVSMVALGARRKRVVLPVALLSPIVIHLAFTTLGVPLRSFWLQV